MSGKMTFDILKIRELLPHRYPFLLIDRVLELEMLEGSSRVGQKATALKNVTVNEPFFNGHFPDRPIMPGVLIVEAMAQAGGIACYKPHPAIPKSLIIASVNNAKFRRPVVPGDQLILRGEIIKEKKNMVFLNCQAHVGETLVAECEILAQVN